jgi:MFS transporter, OFA family, oxalate/formate antiporter
LFQRLLSPQFPFHPKRSPIFYGWIVLLVAVIGSISSIPGQTAGFSPFTDPMIKESGLNRTMLSLAYLIGTLCSGALLSFVGQWIDRIGCRKMIIVTAVCYSISILWISEACRVAHHLHLVTGLPRALLQFICLTTGIFGIRLWGQGMLPTLSSTMVGRWFIRYRGRANSISGIAVGLSFSAAPAVMNELVLRLGWLLTWRYSALWMLFGLGLLGWIFYRDNPEVCGLNPDGKKKETDDSTDNSALEGVEAKVAIRSRCFWAVVIPLGLHGFTITGFTFHISAYARELSVSSNEAMSVFMYVAAISIPVGFIASWSSDKLRLKPYMLIMSFSQIVAYFACTQFNHLLGLVLMSLSLGITSGFFGPLYSIAMPRFFGRKHLGEINSRLTSIMVLLSALGPAVFSLLRDISDSYATGLYICAAIPLVSIFIIKGVQEPKIG